MQGNFVSRDFVLKTLGYSETNFRELTEKEKRGHEMTPVGAIQLTWYHRNSTKVYRNMRFLVSADTPFDLIIGAPSVDEHDLLANKIFNSLQARKANSRLSRTASRSSVPFRIDMSHQTRRFLPEPTSEEPSGQEDSASSKFGFFQGVSGSRNKKRKLDYF
jgi:hypothetical protein